MADTEEPNTEPQEQAPDATESPDATNEAEAPTAGDAAEAPTDTSTAPADVPEDAPAAEKNADATNPADAADAAEEESKAPEAGEAPLESSEDKEKSLACMNEVIECFSFETGLDFEAMSKVQLSRYVSGIPKGLEGLRRALIETGGLDTEGVFRVRGDEDKLTKAKQQLLKSEVPIKDLECDAIEMAQLIKAWFREVNVDEPGIITNKMLGATEEKDMLSEFEQFNEPRRSVILWIIDFMIEIEAHTEKNKMTIGTLAIVFAPNLVRTSSENLMASLTGGNRAQKLLEDLTALRKRNLLKQDPKVEYLPLAKKAAENAAGSGGKGKKRGSRKSKNGKDGKDGKCLIQ